MYFDYGVRLENDFPLEINDNRKELKPILQAAMKIRTKAGGRKYSAYLKTDKLHINGRQYTVKNTDTLPEELKLENISTPLMNGITALFTKHSPLSNHFQSDQKIEGLDYTSNTILYAPKGIRIW